jgi:hypothetical protein
LQEPPKASVVAGDAAQKFLEFWALRLPAGAYRRHHGQQIPRVVLLAPTGPQVDGAVLDGRRWRSDTLLSVIELAKEDRPADRQRGSAPD